MAEAFAALSIAANVAQFVDYARQLVSGGKEIYNSLEGARQEHQALKIIIEDIKNLSDETKPTQSISHASADEKALLKIAAECEPLADKLLTILKDLEVPNDARFRKIQAFRQTFRSAAKKKDIQDLQQRLASIDVRLRERASRILHTKDHSNIISAINALTQVDKRMKIHRDETLEALRVEVMKTLDAHGEEAAKGHTGLENLSKQLLALAEEGKRMSQEQEILKSLVFEEMEQREEAIKDAYKATLNWLFEKTEKNETKFMNWLEAGNGIYWVKGKAGSGKSTLMKYVSNHSITLDALREWAGSKTLVTASFFFWNSGFPMQRSQVGLLQSLLYQVLCACPALISVACPQKGPKQLWKRKELFEALDKVSKQTALSAKFCFFVDGLDEYEGDGEDLIALLQSLASSSSVKLCVSSRPWNAFLDAFDNSEWKLLLENLTKDDMRKYVHSMLVENKVFVQVAGQDPRCKTLVPQITTKSQGVWLWVYLVVRDLLRDLKGEEEFPLLQRRLDSFPGELEKYFANILDRIDKIHREESARIFSVVAQALRSVPLLSMKFLSAEASDPDYAIKSGTAPLSQLEIFQTKTKWRKLLNARCRDLLEVNGTILESMHPHDNKVEFIHRTVRDFLRDNYQDELQRRSGACFDARFSLFKMLLSLVKVSSPATFTLDQSRPNHSLFDMVDEMLYYARDLERKAGQSVTTLLNEMDRVISVHFKDRHWANARETPGVLGSSSEDQREIRHNVDDIIEVQHNTFLALAIQAGLRIYVKEELDHNRALITQKRGRPYLDYTLRPSRIVHAQDIIVDPHMVRLLLEHGADPNEPIELYNNKTPWSLCLIVLCGALSDDRIPWDQERIVDAWYEVMEMMIDNGADPKVRIRHLLEGSLQSFEGFFGQDRAAKLKRLEDEVGQRNGSQTSIFWRLFGRT